MIAAGHVRPGWLVAGAAAVVVLTAALLAVTAVPPLVTAPLAGGLLGLQLDAVAAALAVAAAMLCIVRWRLVGDAAALLLGTGLLLLVLTFGARPMLPLLGDPQAGGELLAWLVPASRLAAAGLLWRAATTAQVDAGLRLTRTLAGALLATLAGVALFVLAPGLARGLASVGDPLHTVEPAQLGSAVLAGAWLLLAAAHARRGWRDRHWLHLWFGVVLLALSLAEAHLLLVGTAAEPVAGPALLHACAMLSALTGATAELVRAFGEQRGRLFEEITSGMTAEARVRAEQLLAQERAHEARNALTAIEGATRTLEVYRDRLDPETQASLARAITAEISRLQRLVSPGEPQSGPAAFGVAETLASVVISARTQGTRVDTALPDDLMASGQPGQTAEVVQNLIENARRYAPGSPVLVRGRQYRGGVLVRVEDRGPGVPESEREAIFRRGYRGRQAAGADGTGLGLYICAKLMREQGGDLWVDERSGGGASFALWLPGAPAAAPGDGARDQEPQIAAGAHAGAPDGQGDAASSNVYPLFGNLPPVREGDGETPAGGVAGPDPSAARQGLGNDS